MVFNTKESFLTFLHYFKKIGIGGDGICYLNKRENKVYKVFHQFFDELDFPCSENHIIYQRDEILKFSHVQANGFIFPSDVIIVNGEIVGFITDFINAKSLYKQNPLDIHLDEFVKAIIEIKKSIKEISENGILTYDVMYNILYKNFFYIIDPDAYTFSDLSSEELEKKNNYNFNQELFFFLIEGYFDEFINKIKVLKNMYQDKESDILIFTKLLREKLSEITGTNITYLKDANNLLNKRKRKVLMYERNLSN